ncbi:MAG TPA: hypothetical protein VG778_05985, partial [Blastocatellia bacterium]|nr:hypothetical protein [Blastocatellia bacterium]
MKTYRSRLLLSAAIALMLLGVVVVQPIASIAQSDNQDGTTKEVAAETEESLEEAESLDKNAVEADPVAPDDRELSANPTAIPAARLHPIPIPLPGGLDHVANGVATRNAGFGTIRLRGTPPGAVAVRAFLYWGTIIDGPAIPLTQTIVFNNGLVTGRLIGRSRPPCWPGRFFVAYRASVIALLNPGIDADYRVSALPSSITDGRDPWLHAPVPAPRPLSEGTSLVVIFAHQNVPLSARVFINHGATMFFGAVSINNPLPVPLPNYNTLKHTRFGADGQVLSSTFAAAPITDERTFIGPGPGPTQIKGP